MAWGTKLTDGDIRNPNEVPSGSLISSEVAIKGNLDAKGDVHLNGEVQGEVICDFFSLGETGCLKGDVTAQRARIAGRIEGTISATEIVLKKSARVTGDILYDSLSVEGGALVDGKLSAKNGARKDLKLVASGAD
jgi:cytoskeletal protein CcmA (bactofilin family)